MALKMHFICYDSWVVILQFLSLFWRAVRAKFFQDLVNRSKSKNMK